MATNTIKTADLAKVADVEFVEKFGDSARKLLELLGQTRAIEMQPGTVLECYSITGSLNTTPRSEGDDIPLTKLEQKLLWSQMIKLEFYRKETTAEAIAKSGYSNAVEKTDAKLVALMQATIKTGIANALKVATTPVTADPSKGIAEFTPTTATGATLKKACLAAWAKLQIVSENYAPATDPVYFVNPEDFSDLVGESDVASAFGFQYAMNVAGLGSMVSTASVDKGVVYVTDKENINVYSIDPSNIEGFDFYVDETGLIGVHHDTEYTNATLETSAVTGYSVFPEVANFVVKATISA